MKILIVDDDEAITTVYSTALSAAGYDVISSTTGMGGVEKAKSEKPDLVLLDQVLTDIPGNEVLANLKQDPTTKDLPIVMLSNYTQNQLMKEAIQIGALDYMLKYQIDPEYLIERVNDLLKESRVNQLLSDTQKPQESGGNPSNSQ
jgi:DNA-binding response OmpR family regulator